MVDEMADWSDFTTTKENPWPRRRRMSIYQWHRRGFQGAVGIPDSSLRIAMVLQSVTLRYVPRKAGRQVIGPINTLNRVSSSSLSDISWHLISQKDSQNFLRRVVRPPPTLACILWSQRVAQP